MQAAKLLSIVLVLVVLETTQSTSEWKKFENGKVESETKGTFKPPKNHTLESEGRKQHILHAHHGVRMSKDKEDGLTQDISTNSDNSWDHPHKNRERHHKTEKKLYMKDAARQLNEDEPARNPQTPTGEEESGTRKNKKKRSKPEGMTSMAWRRTQKEGEDKQIRKLQIRTYDTRADPTKYIRNGKLKTGAMKKKMAISKMDGNQKAKQVWKEAFRGEDRIMKSKN